IVMLSMVTLMSFFSSAMMLYQRGTKSHIFNFVICGYYSPQFGLLGSRKDAKGKELLTCVLMLNSHNPLTTRKIPFFIKSTLKLINNPNFNPANFKYVFNCILCKFETASTDLISRITASAIIISALKAF